MHNVNVPELAKLANLNLLSRSSWGMYLCPFTLIFLQIHLMVEGQICTTERELCSSLYTRGSHLNWESCPHLVWNCIVCTVCFLWILLSTKQLTFTNRHHIFPTMSTFSDKQAFSQKWMFHQFPPHLLFIFSQSSKWHFYWNSPKSTETSPEEFILR